MKHLPVSAISDWHERDATMSAPQDQHDSPIVASAEASQEAKSGSFMKSSE